MVIYYVNQTLKPRVDGEQEECLLLKYNSDKDVPEWWYVR